MVGMLAGLVLIVAAFSALGRAARYLPAPVIEGFTAGIAVVIVLQQVPAMLGSPGRGDKAWQSAAHAARQYLQHPHPWSLVVTLAVAALILLGTRWRPAVPVSLAVVALATAVVASTHLPLAHLGALPNGLPPRPWGSSIRTCSRHWRPQRSLSPRWARWNRCCRPRSPTA